MYRQLLHIPPAVSPVPLPAPVRGSLLHLDDRGINRYPENQHDYQGNGSLVNVKAGQTRNDILILLIGVNDQRYLLPDFIFHIFRAKDTGGALPVTVFNHGPEFGHPDQGIFPGCDLLHFNHFSLHAFAIKQQPPLTCNGQCQDQQEDEPEMDAIQTMNFQN